VKGKHDGISSNKSCGNFEESLERRAEVFFICWHRNFRRFGGKMKKKAQKFPIAMKVGLFVSNSIGNKVLIGQRDYRAPLSKRLAQRIPR